MKTAEAVSPSVVAPAETIVVKGASEPNGQWRAAAVPTAASVGSLPSTTATPGSCG
jgi:hypothetical protein